MGEESSSVANTDSQAMVTAPETGQETVTKKTQLPNQDAKRLSARDAKRSPAEWVTLTLSSFILIAIVGLVLYDWQLTKNLPPAFRIEIVEPARFTEGHYYVPFTLRNTGGRIARTVQVIAQLHLPDGTDESGEQQFDFLSGNERKKGGFVFEHDPQTGNLVIRVASFGLP